MTANESLTGMYLLSNPEDEGDQGERTPDTPFDTAVGLLSTTKGPHLELMCRATKSIAEAAAVSYSMIYRFQSNYIKGRMEQIERLSVSISGQGRGEIVQSLQAGSGVPDAFYETGGGANTTFSEAPDQERPCRKPSNTPARSSTMPTWAAVRCT